MKDTLNWWDVQWEFALHNKNSYNQPTKMKELHCFQLFKSWMITNLLQIQNKYSEVTWYM